MDRRAIIREDLGRNVRLGKLTVLLFRLRQFARSPDRGLLLAILSPLVEVAAFLWIDLLMGASLPPSVECGPGLRLQHGGRGVTLHETARLGRNVTLFQRAGMGLIEPLDDDNESVQETRAPVLEDYVYVGHGAAIFGPITVGERTRIGAGAVVLRDVPAGSTVLPTPARVVTRVAPDAEADSG
ncbi:MAG: hypothetical protein U0V73_12365 [Acidimicrobiia bacterium]